jgi:hypothetical protein
VKGHTVPSLTFDPALFLLGLSQLQMYKYGQKMQSYTPPKDDIFSAILDQSDCNSTLDMRTAEDLSVIYKCWCDLHRNTRQNLLRFEDTEFQLPSRADGEDAVRRLVSSFHGSFMQMIHLHTIQLGELNDIVRLCYRFRLQFLEEPVDNMDWPLLEVEFDSFRNQTIEGTFEVCLLRC